MNILLIDDDTELCELLIEYLETEGLSVKACHDADAGLKAVLTGHHGFVILDVMLPGFSGLDLLRRIRLTSAVPVLMLTARGDEIDRIIGLEMGADDYLPKPFNPRELLARIKAIARRGETAFPGWKQPVARLVAGDISLDPGTRTVLQDKNPLTLTSVEFSLLHMLLKNLGQVVPREDLAGEVLGRKLEMFDRSIDVHISSLRRKLGNSVNGIERIKTVRSVGYMYCALPSSSE